MSRFSAREMAGSPCSQTLIFPIGIFKMKIYNFLPVILVFIALCFNGVDAAHGQPTVADLADRFEENANEYFESRSARVTPDARAKLRKLWRKGAKRLVDSDATERAIRSAERNQEKVLEELMDRGKVGDRYTITGNLADKICDFLGPMWPFCV